MSVDVWTFVSSSTGGTPDITTTGAAVFENVSGNMIYSSDDTRALYVDWDDGEDNSRAKANYQWVEDLGSSTQTTAYTQSPLTLISHVYTATGTFNPLFQTINNKGIFSKYYGSGASSNYTNPPAPYSSRAVVNGISIKDGTATGVLRVENTTVNSGIDNSLYSKEGAGNLYLSIPPLLASSAELSYFDPIKLEIDVVLDYSVISNLSGTAKLGGGKSQISETLDVVISGATLTGNTGFVNILQSGNNGAMPLAAASGAGVSQVLKVTYKNPKIMGDYKTQFTRNDVSNKLKIFLLNSGSDGLMYPITYITPGIPIKSVDEPERFVTFDFGQSRAKASNGGIEKYRYDLGKSWFQPAFKWGIDSSGNFTNATDTTFPTQITSYSYMNRPNGLEGGAVATQSAWPAGGAGEWKTGEPYRTDQFTLNEFGQFYEQQHLARMTAQPSGSGSWFYGAVSPTSDNKPIVYRVTPGINWGPDQAAKDSNYIRAIDYAPLASGNYTAVYTTGASNNLSSQTGLVSLSGMNSTNFLDISGQSRVAQEYIILLFDKKTDSIFFDISNYAANIQSNPAVAATGGAQWGIDSISYLEVRNKNSPKMKIEWKAIPFEDGTAVNKEYRATADSVSGSYVNLKSSLSKSGVISFDMPTDWESVSADDLIGGISWKDNWGEDGHSATSSTYDISVTGMYTSGAVQAGTSYGQYQVITGSLVSGAMSQIGDVEDVGALRYLFLCTRNAEFEPATGSASGQAYWLTKDGGNGWDGDKGLFIHYGSSSYVTPLLSSTGANYPIEGMVRPINVYDFFEGFSKVVNSGTVYNALATVDSDAFTEDSWFPNYWLVGTSGSGIGYSILYEWANNDKYALKVVLSGSETAIGNYPEIWNISDARESNTALITHLDDSAYNLNSLPLTNAITHSQKGQYFKAVTRKGKAYIVKTGLTMAKITLNSVALGKEQSSTAFQDYGVGGSMYHYLHMLRKIQTENVSCYWDEPQKDGTFVRFWGKITTVNETFNVGGPQRVVDYNADFEIEKVAMLDINGELMTDIFPLGGIPDERSYS